MAGVLAENYQLKWHSHSNHLHSSVATLYRSDNFTDVTLVTCDGRYLSAHRFVLSACSSYLNRILQIGSIGTAFNPNMVIILPPDITYRTLAILLQYMYSGEATVSNEQLGGVLRAGEILRIKGLCHSREKRLHLNSMESSSRKDPLSIDTYQGNHLFVDTNDIAANKNQDASSASSSTISQRGSTSKQNTQVPSQTPSNNTEEKTEEQKKSTVKNSKNKQHSNHSELSTKVSTTEGSSGEKSDVVVEDSMKMELLVKEEPLDWDEMDEDANISQEENIETEEVTIKTERPAHGVCQDNNLYAPLTCDMCQETFTTPALWVRHIENHPATELPRKKRKKSQGGEEDDEDEEEEEEYPLLRCELCQKVFTSPADWVRHIQSSHTEEQLALNNSSKHARKNPKVSCASCHKTFPSIASMLIHSRTHTGEKPYVCCVCEKGFNVKSNLLRHLRTLHDHLINPGSQASSVVKES